MVRRIFRTSSFNGVQDEVLSVNRRTSFGPAHDGSEQERTEATLVDQPEKTGLEYRIIAINKAGESQPSNMVMVVL